MDMATARATKILPEQVAAESGVTGVGRRLNVGVMGAGRIATLVHLGNIIGHRRLNLKWITEDDPQRVPVVKDLFGLQNTPFFTSSDLPELLSSKDLDAVFIFTPTGTHCSLVCQSLSKGKAVFVEKPAGVNLEEIRSCYEHSEKFGKPLITGFNKRFDTPYQNVVSAVHNNEVGDIQMIRLTSRDSPKPSYDFLASIDTTGCGILTDVTVHDIDMMVWITKAERPESIYVITHAHDKKMAEFGEADTMVAVVKYKCGIIVTLDTSRYAAYGYDMRMETDVSPCSLDLPPHLGGLLKSYGMLLEYRVSCTGSRASVTLVYGDPVPPKKGRWRKRRRAPAAAQGETKPAAKPPAATPSAGPPNAAQLKRKTKMEVVSAPVINVPSAGTEESDMPDSVFCTSSYIRPDPPAFTSGLPDLSPIKPVASVETQARKTAVVKRKATTPPSATPAKPSRPTQPPNPVEQPEGPWTLKAGKLHPRFHQLIKINIEDVRQLISEPQHSAYLPLPTESDEGEFAVHRVQVDVDITAVCATVRRKGRYNQALLLKEMDNPSLHRVLKLLAGSEYSHIAKWIAASPYRRDLPLLDATDFIGSP